MKSSTVQAKNGHFTLTELYAATSELMQQVDLRDQPVRVRNVVEFNMRGQRIAAISVYEEQES